MNQAVESPLRGKLSPRFFRAGGETPRLTVNFAITQGGLGDYICLLSVLEWIAINYPHVDGRVYCIEWFMPIAENVLGKYPGWRVQRREALTEKKMKSRPTLLPTQQPINRIGASAIDLGFIYYLNMTPAAPDCYYSKLDLSGVECSGIKPPESYAVLTPGASNKPKTLKSKAFNAMKDHLISKGITPVFLGNTTFRGEAFPVHVSEDYNFDGGINLLNKTTTLQAARIMSEAKLVAGIDNGLLHLAAMTEVPIIYGYTISSVEHTKPRRKSGNIQDLYCEPETLPCMFCQSKMRMLRAHDFKDCIYGDTLCAEALGEPEPWIKMIDSVLEDSGAAVNDPSCGIFET